MDRFRYQSKTKLDTDNKWGSVSIHRALQWSRTSDSHNNSKRNHRNKRNRYYQYFLSIIGCLSITTPVLANTDVGGVSATANPVANSSGSVTNQAIQVLQGPYITNTYGNGIQCQGATANITPYITRTGQKSTQNINIGFSATISFPLYKQLQKQCKEAATANIKLMEQTTANKRLDFEIARLKNCGNLMKEGITFHPKSPYYSVCADVVVQNVNNIAPHAHSIPKITPKVSNDASVLKEVSMGYGK